MKDSSSSDDDQPTTEPKIDSIEKILSIYEGHQCEDLEKAKNEFQCRRTDDMSLEEYS